MSEPWQVLSQVIENKRVYIAGRRRDSSAPMHGGNVEYSDDYTTDRDTVEKRVSDLNAAQEGDA